MTRNVLLFIGFITLVRLGTAPFFGYGVDEAHYILYAKHLALSYFDHPPLVGWVHYIFFGQNEFWARVPAIILGAVDSYLIYLLLKDKNEKAAFWAVVALNASLVLGVLFLTLMPDSLLITLMLSSLFVIKRLLAQKTVQNYLLLGIVFGLLGLAKYTAVLFVPALLMYIILIRRFDILLDFRLLLSIVTALVLISPVVVWNMDNNFASLAYQAGHVGGGNGGSLNNFFTSLGRQFAAYNSALFVIAFYGVYKALKAREFGLESSFGLATAIFMLGSQYKQIALPHWISPFFVLFVPIGTYYLYLQKPKLTKYIALISIGLALVVHAELAAKLGKFKDYNSPFRDIVGWDEACKAADKKLIEVNSTNKALAVTNWTIASRAIVYSKAPVYLTDERKDQFDIWEGGEPLGKDLLFINPHTFHKDINGTFKCEELVNMGSFDAVLNGVIVDSFSYELCKNYQGLKK